MKGRKFTSKKYVRNRKKKSFEIQGQKRIVKKGEKKTKIKRVRGGKKKILLLRDEFVNIPKSKKKIEILKVLKTPSNRFLARQNILTKGTIVDTSLGKVRITNRPSQEGNINGVLIEKS